jgi:hypothetical protein
MVPRNFIWIIRKVAYTKYDATWLVPWSNYTSPPFSRSNKGIPNGNTEMFLAAVYTSAKTVE